MFSAMANQSVLNLTSSADFPHLFARNSSNCSPKLFRLYAKQGIADRVSSCAYPIITLFGLFGNALTVLVLHHSVAPKHTKLLLSVLSAADILFFIFFIPFTLESYDDVIKTKKFLIFYVYSKIPLLGIVNWFSTVSIW